MATSERKPNRRPIGLAGLRGFEASARLLSFTLAAEELHLTQSSISRQIKTLESQLGRPLFKRGIRRLELTPAGARLYRVVHDSLANIDRTVGEIRQTTQRKRIALTTFASFASLLLVPRLGRFSARYPDVDISIDASDLPRDLEADGFDLAIRYGPHSRIPRDAVLLQEQRLLPVLSPALAAKVGPIEKPRDFARTTFLLDHMPPDDGYEDWDRWFRLVGDAMPDDAPTLSLNYTSQSVEATLRGQGVTLAPLIYVREYLERGELLCPIPVPLVTSYGYYLLTNRQTGRTPHVAAFRQWLLDELQVAPEADSPARQRDAESD